MTIAVTVLLAIFATCLLAIATGLAGSRRKVYAAQRDAARAAADYHYGLATTAARQREAISAALAELESSAGGEVVPAKVIGLLYAAHEASPPGVSAPSR